MNEGHAAMKRALFLALLGVLLGCGWGCGGATAAPAKSRPAPTDADACERYCAALDDCRIAQPNCAAACAADQKRLRDGVQPALVTCVEREFAGCEHRELGERRQIVSLCFAAVLEAFSTDGSAMGTIARAVCARQAKCAPSPDPDCEQQIRDRYKNSPQSKVLGIVRPELLNKAAACIAVASCDDPDPIASCSND